MKPTRTLLWPDGAPGGGASAEGEPPTLTRYDPPAASANGAAFVVCPGGGYVMLADHEGEPVAQWLNTLGVTAWVLRYRLSPYSRHPMMLQDAERAVRTVRANAAAWGIDPARIGILGFSAGGHLATSLATHHDAGDPDSPDPIERVSSRPDLAAPIYPVVTLQPPHGHAWCAQCLFGDPPDPAMAAEFSNQLRVTPETPPMFLVHSRDDRGVPCENSLLMAQALSEARVPFELHLYEGGGHGYGLGGDDPYAHRWPAHCGEWLQARGFLQNEPAE